MIGQEAKEVVRTVTALNVAFLAYMEAFTQVCGDLRRIQDIDAASYRDVLTILSKVRSNSTREELAEILAKTVELLAANCGEVSHEATLALVQISTASEKIMTDFNNR